MSLMREDEFIKGDTTKAAKQKEWFKTIKKDIYINETISIINDMN
jgi:hypothetical protein